MSAIPASSDATDPRFDERDNAQVWPVDNGDVPLQKIGVRYNFVAARESGCQFPRQRLGDVLLHVGFATTMARSS